MEKKTDFKAMKKSELAGYIWDYYKWYIIVGVIVIAAVIGAVIHFRSFKDAVVNVALINSELVGQEAESKNIFAGYMEKYGYDPEKEEVALNTGYRFGMDSNTKLEMESFQSCYAMTVGGGIDILVSDDDELHRFLGENFMMANLSKYLPGDVLKKYEDDLIYATVKEEQWPVGIRLSQDSLLVSSGFYGKECCVGIAQGAARGEEASQLLLYLLGED